MVKKNTCIFISGKGSNLKNLINKSREYNFPIKLNLLYAIIQKLKVLYMQRKIQFHT